MADATAAIKATGVNIAAISAYERDGEGKLLLVTDDNAKAAQALARLNAEVREKGVLLVDLEDRPGTLEAAARTLAEADIKVEYAYGTAVPGGVARVVMKTSDDQRALGLF